MSQIFESLKSWKFKKFRKEIGWRAQKRKRCCGNGGLGRSSSTFFLTPTYCAVKKDFAKTFAKFFEDFCKFFRSFLELFEVFGHVRTHSDPFGPAGTHSDAFGRIRKRLEVFGKIRIFLNVWIGFWWFRAYFDKKLFSRQYMSTSTLHHTICLV